MTESSGRLDPLQSNQQSLSLHFCGEIPKDGKRKLDQEQRQWERDETEQFLFLPKQLSLCLEIKCITVYVTIYYLDNMAK